MKKMILFLFVLILAGATKLQAQNGGGGQMQQAMRDYLKDSVNLSPAMVDSVVAVRREYQPQMREIFMDQSANDGDKKTKLDKLRTEMDARYKAAGLTDEQIQKIHAREDRMRAEMRSRMSNGRQ